MTCKLWPTSRRDIRGEPCEWCTGCPPVIAYPNAIPPFLATVLVPSPCSTLVSSEKCVPCRQRNSQSGLPPQRAL